MITLDEARRLVKEVNDRLYMKLPALITDTQGGIKVVIHVENGGLQIRIEYPPAIDKIKINK
jgi:hypothetical protein